MIKLAILMECDFCHKKEFFEKKKGKEKSEQKVYLLRFNGTPIKFNPEKVNFFDLFLNNNYHFCSIECSNKHYEEYQKRFGGL